MDVNTKFMLYLKESFEFPHFGDQGYKTKRKTIASKDYAIQRCQKEPKKESEDNGPHFSICDTLSHDDVVREQYSLLPYPAVDENDILHQWKHYNSDNQHIPFKAKHTLTLENLNHFLFKGRKSYVELCPHK